MKLYLLVLAALAASPAAAQDAPLAIYEARAVLATPAGAPKSAVIDGRSWRCEGTLCVGRAAAAPKSQPVAFECQRAARSLGPLVRYTTREEREERSMGAGCRNP